MKSFVFFAFLLFLCVVESCIGSFIELEYTLSKSFISRINSFLRCGFDREIFYLSNHVLCLKKAVGSRLNSIRHVFFDHFSHRIVRIKCFCDQNTSFRSWKTPPSNPLLKKEFILDIKFLFSVYSNPTKNPMQDSIALL